METENYTNQDLKKIERLAPDNKIEFNDKKSKVFIYIKEKKWRPGSKYLLELQKTGQTEEMKYLGIYLDSKFNFNAHIDLLWQN